MTCIFVIYHVMIPGNSVSAFDASFYTWIKTFNEQLATVALSYFFGVTGYLLFRNMNKESLVRKIRTRVVTLLVPYIIWQALILGIFYLTGRYRTVDTLVYYLKATFLFKSYPPDIPLWYVYAVFAWVLLSPILLLLLKNKNVGFVILMAAFVGIYLVSTKEACSSFYHYGLVALILKYSFAYLLGAFFGLHFPDPHDLESLKYIAFTLLFGFVVSSTALSEFRTSFIIAVIPILLIRFFPEKLCKERKIYKTSFLIFAIHYPLYQYSLDLIKKMDLSSVPVSVINILLRILFLLVVILLAYLIYSLLSRFAPKVLGFITGGRA